MIFLVIIWAIFFSPWLFSNLHPIPSDIISGMYYPFIEQQLGPVAGIPVKNPLLTDTVSQFWIWRNWAMDTIKTGEIAIWNPYSLAGQSMSPWFHTIIFSPLNVFYLIFSNINAMSAVVAAQTILSLIFSYLFFRQLTSSKFASIFGSLAYSFSSFFIGWLTWGTVSATLAFLPLTLYSITSIKISNKKRYRMLLYISNLFALLSGHPQTYLYFLIITLSYIISQQVVKKTMSTIILSWFSATFVLLPSIEILHNSIRSVDQFIKNNHYGFIHPFEIVASLISPSFFGTPSTNNYWGILSNFQEKLVWYGVIPLTFTLSWLIEKYTTAKYTRFDLWLVFLFLLGILLSTEYPFGFLIYKLNTPLLSSSPAGRGFVLTIFAAIVMATQYFSSGKKPYFKIPLVTTFSLYITLIIFNYLNLVRPQDIRVSLRNLTLSAGLLCILFLASFIKGRIFYFITISFTVIELIYFSVKYTPFTPKAYFFPQNKLLESIHPKNDFYRVEREKSELLPPNMWQAYQLSSTQGYDPTLNLNYLKYLQKEGLVVDPTRFIEWKVEDILSLENLGIKYALVLKKDDNNRISPSGKPPKNLLENNWKVSQESGSVVIMSNPRYKPIYGLSHPGKIQLTNKSDNGWEFQIDSPTQNSLYIYENNDPLNWNAQIDSTFVPIKTIQGTFKSITLPEGAHKVTFKYINKPFLYGCYLSFLSLITFIIHLYIFKKNNDSKT